MKPLISDETLRDGDTRRTKDGLDVYLNGKWEDYAVVNKRHHDAMVKEYGVDFVESLKNINNPPYREVSVVDISGPKWDKFREGLVVEHE